MSASLVGSEMCIRDRGGQALEEPLKVLAEPPEGLHGGGQDPVLVARDLVLVGARGRRAGVAAVPRRKRAARRHVNQHCRVADPRPALHVHDR
eukprot:14693420-Alexandrium_andersonii.AAC.1